jgi:hypothetical protein
MNVCILSKVEKEALELHDRVPNCRAHPHEKFKLAAQLVDDEGAQWVGKGNRRIFKFMPKVWAVRNFNLQMVDGVIQGRVGSFRYPIEACGARSRRLAPGHSVTSNFATA